MNVVHIVFDFLDIRNSHMKMILSQDGANPFGNNNVLRILATFYGLVVVYI